MTMTQAKQQLLAITNEVGILMDNCIAYANDAESLHAEGPAESLRLIAGQMEQWIANTRKNYCKNVKKDIVTVTCYGIEKQMERNEAIRFYSEGVLACDGSEKQRYANILAQLATGSKFCHD